MTEPQSLLNEHQAAKYLGVSVSTLQQRRFRGRLPKYLKIGKSVRYPVADLQDFIDSCRVRVDEG